MSDRIEKIRQKFDVDRFDLFVLLVSWNRLNEVQKIGLYNSVEDAKKDLKVKMKKWGRKKQVFEVEMENELMAKIKIEDGVYGHVVFLTNMDRDCFYNPAEQVD